MTLLEKDGYLILRQAIRMCNNAPEWAQVSAYDAAYGSIQDDLWPRNLYIVEFPTETLIGKELTRDIVKLARAYVPTHTHIPLTRLHCTTAYPHSGRWHRDAEVGEAHRYHATLGIAGCDELKLIPTSHRVTGFEALLMTREFCPSEQPINLFQGDLVIYNAACLHRGYCSATRLSWYVQLNVAPTAPREPARLPRLTVAGAIKRTFRTLVYWLIRPEENGWWCRRFTWAIPYLRQGE